MRKRVTYINKMWSEGERKLRHRMVDLSMTASDVAKAADIHIANVSCVLAGRSKSPQTIAKVYECLGLEPPA